MSVYNGAQHLEDTIESVLANSGVEYEFIIINDGSSDESLNIIQDYAENYSQINVIAQANMGLTKSLIKGCHQAQGDFIARIDAGDLCSHNRLRLQANILNKNPELVLLGSFVNFIDNNNHIFPFPHPHPPVFDKALKNILERENTFSHGSVMFRKDKYFQVGGYRKHFRYAQDYDLWWRLSEEGHIGMLPQMLTTLRWNREGISFQNREAQIHFAAQASTLYYAKRNFHQNINELSQLDNMSFVNIPSINTILKRHYRTGNNAQLISNGYDVTCTKYCLLKDSMAFYSIKWTIYLWLYILLGKNVFAKIKTFMHKIRLIISNNN